MKKEKEFTIEKLIKMLRDIRYDLDNRKYVIINVKGKIKTKKKRKGMDMKIKEIRDVVATLKANCDKWELAKWRSVLRLFLDYKVIIGSGFLNVKHGNYGNYCKWSRLEYWYFLKRERKGRCYHYKSKLTKNQINKVLKMLEV